MDRHTAMLYQFGGYYSYSYGYGNGCDASTLALPSALTYHTLVALVLISSTLLTQQLWSPILDQHQTLSVHKTSCNHLQLLDDNGLWRKQSLDCNEEPLMGQRLLDNNWKALKRPNILQWLSVLIGGENLWPTSEAIILDKRLVVVVVVVRPLLMSTHATMRADGNNIWPSSNSSVENTTEMDGRSRLWWEEAIVGEQCYGMAGCSTMGQQLDQFGLGQIDYKGFLTDKKAQLLDNIDDDRRPKGMVTMNEEHGICSGLHSKCDDRLWDLVGDTAEDPIVRNVSLAEAALQNTALNVSESGLEAPFDSGWNGTLNDDDDGGDSGLGECCCVASSENGRLEGIDGTFVALECGPSNDVLQSSSTCQAQRQRPVCTSPQFRLPCDTSEPIWGAWSRMSRTSYCELISKNGNDEESVSSGAQCSCSSSQSSRASQSTFSSSCERYTSEPPNDENVVHGRGRRSRDEQLARQYALPMSAAQITSIPLVELNRVIHSTHLTQAQLNLMRKIRRRGKNKLAARTCRKRKQLSERF